MAMPMESQYIGEMHGDGYPYGGSVDVDSPQRGIAKRSIDETYGLLKKLTVPRGEQLGSGSQSNTVNVAIPGFSGTYMEIGLWNQ
jgi:hypothetical protein